MKPDHVRTAPLSVCRAALLAALVGLSGLSHAQTVTLSKFPPNPGVMPGGGFEFKSNSTFADPPPQRAWVNGVYGSVPGAKAVDSITVRGPAGDLPLRVGKSVSNAAIGMAAAKAAAKALPTVAVGVALWDIWDNLRVRPDGAGGLVTDAGQEPEEVTTVECQTMVGQGTGNPSLAKNSANSPLAACEPLKAQVPTNWNTGSAGPAYPVGEMQCSQATSGSCTQLFFVPFLGNQSITFSFGPKVIRRCPAVVDFSNPAYSVPGGPTGFDGKCPTGRYDRPLPFQQAADRFAAQPPADPSSVARDAINRGEEIVASPAGIEGPASQTGTPTSTTTTNPDGTTRTETKTPSYSYTYSPSSVTYNTTVTTVINNAGNITTTTTTTDNTPKQDPEDQCVKNPDTLGCAKFGEAPEGEVPKTEKPITYAPVPFAGGSCPASVPWSAFGRSYAFEFTPLCDAASTWVRGVVLLVATVLGAFIFVGGLKS